MKRNVFIRKRGRRAVLATKKLGIRSPAQLGEFAGAKALASSLCALRETGMGCGNGGSRQPQAPTLHSEARPPRSGPELGANETR